MNSPEKQTIESVQPLQEVRPQSIRNRLGIKGELLLAAVPTMMILFVLATVETLSNQRLLFASLASSAFLIYLDPTHATNTTKSLAASHSSAAISGAVAFAFFGAGYVAAAAAMVVVIILMVTLDVVHPPAVSTALGFAFRPENIRGIAVFFAAVGMICILILLQRALLWGLSYARQRSGR